MRNLTHRIGSAGCSATNEGFFAWPASTGGVSLPVAVSKRET
jgi:hypothetical protein